MKVQTEINRMEAISEFARRGVGQLPSFVDSPAGRVLVGARINGPQALASLWTGNNIIAGGLVGLYLFSIFRPPMIKTFAHGPPPRPEHRNEARALAGGDADLIGREAHAPPAELVAKRLDEPFIFTTALRRSGFKAPSMQSRKARKEDLRAPPRPVSAIHQHLGEDYAHDTLPGQNRRG